MIKTLFEFLKTGDLLKLWREFKKKDSQTVFYRLVILFLVCFIIYRLGFSTKSKTDEFESWVISSPVINQKLEQIRTDFNADYSAVYLFHNGKSMLSEQSLMYFDQIFHSDCIECQYEANLFQNLPIAQFSYSINSMKTNPYVYCRDLSKPFLLSTSKSEVIEFYQLRRMLTSFGTQSIALCAIYSKEKYSFFGLCKTDERKMIGFMTLEFKATSKLKIKDLKYFARRVTEVEGEINNIK